VSPDPARWNHNIHYHPILLAAVPPGCGRALDVGCGEGTLTRKLRPLVHQLTAIDRDERMLELAARHPCGGHIEYVRGDFLTYPFEPASFAFITCVAALHHMDSATALVRMRALLEPGGTLAVVGLVRRNLPAELPRELAAALATRVHGALRARWQSPAATTPPPAELWRASSHSARSAPGSAHTPAPAVALLADLDRYARLKRRPSTGDSSSSSTARAASASSAAIRSGVIASGSSFSASQTRASAARCSSRTTVLPAA
jgi:SAM-dependent methyltransferase